MYANLFILPVFVAGEVRSLVWSWLIDIPDAVREDNGNDKGNNAWSSRTR